LEADRANAVGNGLRSEIPNVLEGGPRQSKARDERLLQQGLLGDRILEAVRANPDSTLDELIVRVSGASWSEVFLEVDRLSRSGQLRLTKSRSGLTTTLRAV